MVINKSLASSFFRISRNNTMKGAERKVKDSSFSMFSDVFSEAVDRSSNAGPDKKAISSGNVREENSYQKTNSDNRVRTKKEAVKPENTDSIKAPEALKENEKEKHIKKYLAENLNIDVCELELLLDKFNIDVMNIEDNKEAFNSLKEFLGLGFEEEKTLLKAIWLANEEVENTESVNSGHLKTNEDKENWIKIQGFEVEVKENTVNTDMEELSFKIKEGLKELSDERAEKLPERTSQNTEKITDGSSENVIKKQEAEIKKDEILDDISQNKYVEAKRPTAQKSNLSNNEESEAEGHLFRQDDKVPEEKPESIRQMEFKNMFSENIKGFEQLKEPTVSHKTEFVPKREIAFQIVEKAKVLLTGDKSEMIMDLKPDHLGRLSLKLVTERGIVVAKFIAENEEVRAAIEANMDTLKESLEKQGFSVQEFSVSVNQNKSNNQDEYGENPKNLRKSNTEDKGILSVNAANTDIEIEIAKTNPYILGGSSINLTA